MNTAVRAFERPCSWIPDQVRDDAFPDRRPARRRRPLPAGTPPPKRRRVDNEPIKAAVAAWTGLERDALHTYFAFIIQLGAAAVFRRTLASPWPWLVVLAFALTNEWLDMFGDNVVEEWEKAAALHDLWNTMLLPTVLLVVAKFAPGLLARRPPPPPPPSE
jgi:hypothetical protein